jgi:hypothetical protein
MIIRFGRTRVPSVCAANGVIILEGGLGAVGSGTSQQHPLAPKC